MKKSAPVIFILIFTFITLPHFSFSPVYGQNQPQTEQSNKAQEIIKEAGKDKDSFAEGIARRESELKKREEALKAEEARLAQIKKELSDEMGRITTLRREIEKMLTDNKALLGLAEGEQEKKLRQLAKIYESMPPDQLAVILEKLDVNLALAVVSRMKPKQAAKAMAAVNPDLSALLSKRMGSPGTPKDK